MMLYLAFLVFLGLSSVDAVCTRNYTPCLNYTVLQTHEDYEEREYPPIVWASVSAEAKEKMNVSRSLIKMLYAYHNNGNDKNVRIPMVVPVRTLKVINGETNIYTMAIALTSEQTDDPPLPLDPNVILTREPRTVYVVRSFGGLARKDDIWDKQANFLKDSVANDDSIDTSFYYINVYDSPMVTKNRLNEVWMIKRSNIL